jgi:hypothetical protein
MTGGKVPESKKPGVFAEAIAKAKNLSGRFQKAREMSEELADAVIATAETQGTVFAATFAEGYLGEEKMDIGPVDLRLGGGLLLGGYGLYKTMSGKGGSHALALGNGLMAAGIGRIGRHAGRALAEKKNGPATLPAQAPAAAPAPVAAPPAQLKHRRRRRGGTPPGPRQPSRPRRRRRGRGRARPLHPRTPLNP